MSKDKRVTRGEKMQELLKEHTVTYKNRKQFVFKNHSDNEFRECTGAYNSKLTRAITHDAMQLSVLFADVRSDVIDIMLKINQLDDNLMRMIDDREAGRDLIDFDYGSVATLIERISKIKPDVKVNKELAENIRDLLILSVMRLSYMVKWANYLQTLERIESFEFDSTVQMFDADGVNQLDGLSDEDIKDIRMFLDYEKKFLYLYLTAVADSEEEEKSFTEALKMEYMAKLIAEGKVDEFLEEHK